MTLSPIRVAAGTARASKPDNLGGGGGRGAEQRQERLRLISTRLAAAAAGEHRQQRDKVFALRLLAEWRRAAARERARREALSRLLRGLRRRRLNRGFARWRSGAQATRSKEERRAATEGAAAAAATAKEAVAAAGKAAESARAATTAKAAAEKLAREREKELRDEKAAAAELRKTVERLQAEVCWLCQYTGAAAPCLAGSARLLYL